MIFPFSVFVFLSCNQHLGEYLNLNKKNIQPKNNHWLGMLGSGWRWRGKLGSDVETVGKIILK